MRNTMERLRLALAGQSTSLELFTVLSHLDLFAL